jgi:capsular polysaccharide biosynthesis protein
MNEARTHQDDLKLRAERAKLAVEAARSQAAERMAIIDPPFQPTHPSKGARTNAAIAGLAMAVLLALGYATLRVSLDDTLVDADDIEGLAVAPVLGVVPRIGAGRTSKELRNAAA